MKQIPNIPYFQTSRYRVQTMIELAQIVPNDIGADLGSGDGRIVIAFAKQGIPMHGFELNHSLGKQSLVQIEQAGLLQNAWIHADDFWTQSLTCFSIITIYGMPDIMDQLGKKLQKELKTGTKILSNYYPFPTWKPQKETNHIYLYRI